MRSNFKKTFTLTCIASLMIASLAIAEDQKELRRDLRNGQGSRGQGQMGGGMGEGVGQGMPMVNRRRMGIGQGMGSGRGMNSVRGGGLIPEMIHQKLNLTEEQEKAVNELLQVQMKEHKEISKRHESLRNELDAAVDKSDKGAIAKTAEQIGENICNTALLKVSGKESLKKILNKTQLERIEKFKLQMKQRREKMEKIIRQRTRGEGLRPPMRQEGDDREISERQKRRMERQERSKCSRQ